MTIVMTLLLGFAYPAAVWGVGRLAFREKADGSFLRMKEGGTRGTAEGPHASLAGTPADASGDRIVGSALLGQSFHSKNLFHGRPSAAGDAGYDATASGATNLGPTSKKLAESIRAVVTAARAENPGAGNSPVPADATTSSGSGLDPHVSPEYALWQVPRVSRETGIPTAALDHMVSARTERRFLGLWGAPRVNVLLLNLDLVARGAAP